MLAASHTIMLTEPNVLIILAYDPVLYIYRRPQNFVVSDFLDYHVFIRKVQFRDENFHDFKSAISDPRLYVGSKLYEITKFWSPTVHHNNYTKIIMLA